MISLSSSSIVVGLRIGLVIVADEMKKAMHREMGEMMQEWRCFLGAFALQAFHRR